MGRFMVLLVIARAGASVLVMVYAASLPYLVVDWGLSATEAGAIQAAFNLSYAVSLFTCSWASDRFGPKRIFAYSNWAAAILFSFCILFAQSFESAIVVFAVMGLALGGSYTPSLMLAARHMPVELRGAAMGWILTGSSLGYFIAIASGPALIANWGYRSAWLMLLIFPCLAAIAGTIAVRGLAEPTSHLTPQRASGSIAPTLMSRKSVLLTGGYTAHSWELLGMWAWAPAFLTYTLSDQLPIGSVGIGLVIAASLHLSGAAATVFGGMASDRLGRRSVLIFMGIGGALASFAFGWSNELGPAAVIILAALYGFLTLGDSGVFSAAMTEAVPQEHLGSMFALRSIVGFGAGAISPIALGWVLDLTNEPGAPPDNWGWAFAMLGLGGFAASICAMALPKERRNAKT